MWGAILLILGCAFVFFLCLIPLYSKKLNNKRTWLSTLSGGVILVLLVSSYFYFKFDETKSNQKVSASEEEIKQREIKEEDKKYIKLLEENQYDTVIKETKELNEDHALKDYYYLASAFKKEEDIKNDDKSGSTNNSYYASEQLRHEYITDNLDKVKVVPSELQDKVNTLQEYALEKSEYYKGLHEERTDSLKSEWEQQEIQKQIDKNTENPGTVTIGMTKEEVLTEGWGRPKDINKTTSANGTSEQWVYNNNNYLYFEDGILTSIQN